MIRALKSLCTPGCKLLIRVDKDWEDSTKFQINEQFKHKLYKIKLPIPRITEEESQKTQASVSGDRICVLDAAIVRVMKARKQMKLQRVMQEVTKQCAERFTPEPKQIKQRIESLIDREYLKVIIVESQVTL